MNEQDYRQSMQYIENFYQKQQIQASSQNQSHDGGDEEYDLERAPVAIKPFQSVSPLRLQFTDGDSRMKSSIGAKDDRIGITDLDMNPISSVQLDKSCEEQSN